MTYDKNTKAYIQRSGEADATINSIYEDFRIILGKEYKAKEVIKKS
ncbi:hypothetical protein JQ035_05330 [Clostridium botulinum]|nr:hypothetical protein [Clostridium botulinum]